MPSTSFLLHLVPLLLLFFFTAFAANTNHKINIIHDIPIIHDNGYPSFSLLPPPHNHTSSPLKHPSHTRLNASSPGSCDTLPGVWTGFDPGNKPLYDEYYLQFEQGAPQGTFTAIVVAPPPGGGGGEGWTIATGILSPDNTSVTITFDSGLTLHGNVSSDCTLIQWEENDTAWGRTSGIKTVHLVHMWHLDIGYNGVPIVGLINNILNIYFNIYFPRAIALARALRDLGGDERYLLTTHAWLVSLYLHCPDNFTLSGIVLQCPTPDEVAEFRDAVTAGDIRWHAAPFNTEWENVFNAEGVNFQLSLAKLLADEFGLPHPTTVSLRDVPGTTRGLVPLLVANNITGISIGVNDAAPNADMPNPGIWRDPDTNTSVFYMQTGPGICYPWPPGADPLHPGGLGVPSCVVFEGLQHAMCWAFRIDNSGPPDTVEEVLNDFTIARWQFPGAQVWSSTFDNFTQHLSEVASELPVSTAEAGDNWIQSTTADPWKMIYYREASRAYAICVSSGQCDPVNDPRVYGYMRMLSKLPEHTWGLPSFADTTHFTNDQFHSLIANNDSTYLTTLHSYTEQNDIVTVEGTRYLADHPLAANISARMAALVPAIPNTASLYSVPASQWTAPITFAGTSIGLDGVTGALSTLTMAGTQWADASHLVGEFVYKTFDDTDYATQGSYCCWGVGGRQSISNPNSTTSTPTLTGVWYDSQSNPQRIVASMSMPSIQVENYGAPATLWVTYVIHAADGSVSMDLQAFNKTATRLGEAFFVSWLPRLPYSSWSSSSLSDSSSSTSSTPTQATTATTNDYIWKMKKLASWIDPLDSVSGGSPHSHGVSDGIAYASLSSPTTNFFAIDTLDSIAVSPITQTSPATNFIVPFTALEGPVLGFASLLFQNAFNTNTPQFSWQPDFHWRYVFRASSSNV